MVCKRCGYEYCECHDHEEQYGDDERSQDNAERLAELRDEYGFENIPDDAWDDYDNEYPHDCGMEL